MATRSRSESPESVVPGAQPTSLAIAKDAVDPMVKTPSNVAASKKPSDTLAAEKSAAQAVSDVSPPNKCDGILADTPDDRTPSTDIVGGVMSNVNWLIASILSHSKLVWLLVVAVGRISIRLRIVIIPDDMS
jgi:hypothetical protein